LSRSQPWSIDWMPNTGRQTPKSVAADRADVRKNPHSLQI
jgi:hypothetical protein